jgi:diguanylate cyclase (GGDEF)-like protein
VLVITRAGFTAANDSLGHGAGDRLLGEVARRLQHAVGPDDALARFAGDEFTVLLEDVADAHHALRAAERLLACVSDPVEVGGAEVVPQASAGLAIARAGLSAEELLREAECALLEAKAKGRGRCQIFEGPLDRRALALLRMESELRRALDREEFRTHYEPTVAVKGSKVNGFEVVLWRRSLPRARAGNA